MKILYLHQYFQTPEQGGAIRSYHLAKALINAGHEVEMITSHNHLNYHYENIEGIKVHYLPVYYENNLSFIGRVISFTKFLLNAYQKATEVENIDLCYASSTPLTIGLIALWLKRFHGINYYFEVRDLWPEAPIQMGVIKNYFLKRYLFYLEKKLYKKATKVIALSPGIAEGIKAKVSESKIYLIPNFSDCTFFQPENKKNELEIKYGVKNKFVISYFGAIGKSNHLEYLIDCAKELSKNTTLSIHFIISGKGGELHHIKELVDKFKITNISFTGFINKNNLREILNISDATYISFANKKILETNSPNKFFDGLAAGKLCITNIRGWTKELAEENNCGFYYNANNPSEFIKKLIPFINNPELLKTAQVNARKLAENKFSKDIICNRYIELFNR